MLCIPTLVVLSDQDPELAHALLAMRSRTALLEKIGVGEPEAADTWRYMASIPFREDNGIVSYVHVFRTESGQPGDPPRAMGVAASPGWWPSDHRSLAPRRTAPRARLRLVS